MKIVRFIRKGTPTYGIVRDDIVYLAEGDIEKGFHPGEKADPVGNIKLLVPCEPTKVVGHGLNYKQAFKEMKKEFFKEPSRIYMKSNTALLAHLENIVLPPHSKEVVHEAELVMVVSRKAKNVKAEEARQYILGYTCGNDVTAWDLLKADGWPIRAKSFDTFAPVGPWIITDLNPSDLAIKSRVNGTLVQDARTSDFVFSPEKILSYFSSIFTLFPGDVIFTGSPHGWGPIKPRDEVEIEIEGIGILKNSVISDQ